MTRPHIDDAERRRRLVVRHRLALEAPAGSVAEAAEATVGLHGSDPTTAFLAAWARVPGLAIADVDRALYETREVLRVLGMRRTLFVVPPDLAAIIRSACTEPIARAERKRLIGFLESADPSRDAVAWLARVEADVEAALDRRGTAAATELTADVPALGEQFAYGEGKRWAGTFGLSTRLLFLMAAEWRVIRGRPRGSWISGQYRWAHLSTWVPDLPPSPPPPEARRELVRRWLAAFGPGTERDLAWWTGLTLGQVRAAIGGLETTPVRLDEGEGIALASDLKPTPTPAPRAVFLPALDATPMGWKLRDWFLGPHAEALFDLNGNCGPTVWWDGAVIGSWGQLGDGTVIHRLLEDRGREAAKACEAVAAELSAWLGGTRVSPRFPTPLQKMLANGDQPGA